MRKWTIRARAFAVFACALLLVLTGCAGGDPGSGSGNGASAKSITVYNWADYIDPDTLKAFEQESGIKVNYVMFTTNEDMYIKLKNDDGAYDVIFPSDYMIERMKKEDLLLPLDHEKLPNLTNVNEWIANADYDPGMVYSAPYMWGTVGILYNTDVTGGPIDSWDAMWDPKYKNNILMMNSIRDSIGVTLKKLGYSLNTRDEAELTAAKDELIRQADVRLGFGVDEIKDKLESGDVALGLVWSGDAYNTIQKNDKLAYCVPKEGSNLWFDGMCIPKGSKNAEGALAFIDYMLRPDVAAKNSEYIGYSTPIPAALDLLPAEMVADDTFNPPQDVLDRCEIMADLEGSIDVYNKMWIEITSR